MHLLTQVIIAIDHVMKERLEKTVKNIAIVRIRALVIHRPVNVHAVLDGPVNFVKRSAALVHSAIIVPINVIAISIIQ